MNTLSNSKKRSRCEWAEGNELLISYHDNEWGVPVHDDQLLFEMLNLEGAQAGLIGIIRWCQHLNDLGRVAKL